MPVSVYVFLQRYVPTKDDIFFGSRINVTVIVTRLRIARLGVRMPQGDFYVPQNVPTGSEPQPPSYAMGTETVPGVQQLVHEVDHSYSPTAKVRNGWSYISTPRICLHGVNREKSYFFTFYDLVFKL